jgi:hypothetical protein
MRFPTVAWSPSPIGLPKRKPQRWRTFVSWGETAGSQVCDPNLGPTYVTCEGEIEHPEASFSSIGDARDYRRETWGVVDLARVGENAGLAPTVGCDGQYVPLIYDAFNDPSGQRWDGLIGGGTVTQVPGPDYGAVGGEMEGAGVWAASVRNGTDWIVVKEYVIGQTGESTTVFKSWQQRHQCLWSIMCSATRYARRSLLNVSDNSMCASQAAPSIVE